MVNGRSLGYCERCGGLGAELHHRKRGNPRSHTCQNLVRLCRPCHHWATIEPTAAKKTGWVLGWEDSRWIPVPLLGRVWAWLHPAGVYVIEGSTMRDIRDVWESVEVDWFPRPDRSLALPDLPSVDAGETDDLSLGPVGSLSQRTDPASRVRIPARFRYEVGDTLDDLALRIEEEKEAVDGVDEGVEPVD